MHSYYYSKEPRTTVAILLSCSYIVKLSPLSFCRTHLIRLKKYFSLVYFHIRVNHCSIQRVARGGIERQTKLCWEAGTLNSKAPKQVTCQQHGDTLLSISSRPPSSGDGDASDDTSSATGASAEPLGAALTSSTLSSAGVSGFSVTTTV